MAAGPLVNPTILGLTGQLLVLPDFRSIVSETNGLDVELLLDFILCVCIRSFRPHGTLLTMCSYFTTIAYQIRASQTPTERPGGWCSNWYLIKTFCPNLYLSMVSRPRVILLQTPLVWEDLETFTKANMEHSQSLWKCYTKAKKKLAHCHLVSFDDTDLFCKDSLYKDFCREALAWRSLSHRFIIPLLGIFEEKSHLFLVSPFMTKGTLTKWRENCSPPVPAEIHRLVRFQHFFGQLNEITLMR